MYTINDIKVKYINLDRCEIRRHLQEERLSLIDGLKYERFSAIDLHNNPSDPRVKEYFGCDTDDAASRFNSFNPNSHTSHKSLVLSNLICMESSIKDMEEEYLLILEDDALLDIEHIEIILDKLNNAEIDYLWLDKRGMGCAANLFRKSILPTVCDDLNVYKGKFLMNYKEKYGRTALWDFVVSSYFVKEKKNDKRYDRLHLVTSGLLPSCLNNGNYNFDFENINEYLTSLLSVGDAPGKKLWVEGNIATFGKKLNKLISLCSSPNVSTVLEIGFNSGYSSHKILSLCPNVKHLTSIDIGRHRYVKFANYIMEHKFGCDRFSLLLGKSEDVLVRDADKMKKTYDLIFIDGGHTFDCAFNDILLCKNFSNEKTLVIMDDVNISNDEQKFVKQPTDAVLKHERDGYINDVTYMADGKNGFAMFYYN
jgi:predicted O-methyltransferase YrrM